MAAWISHTDAIILAIPLGLLLGMALSARGKR